jgi:hypothetical protein
MLFFFISTLIFTKILKRICFRIVEQCEPLNGLHLRTVMAPRVAAIDLQTQNYYCIITISRYTVWNGFSRRCIRAITLTHSHAHTHTHNSNICFNIIFSFTHK